MRLQGRSPALSMAGGGQKPKNGDFGEDGVMGPFPTHRPISGTDAGRLTSLLPLACARKDCRRQIIGATGVFGGRKGYFPLFLTGSHTT